MRKTKGAAGIWYIKKKKNVIQNGYKRANKQAKQKPTESKTDEEKTKGIKREEVDKKGRQKKENAKKK
jgi:hypothetical protein